ncbi:MAG: 1,4-alpha-glucan branching protein GlgB [Longispora sp.]|nr:1,4-alpha-glucan branching protein GlgB [Longispora sp. (in: high G+C Gram-positive bacteria)]
MITLAPSATSAQVIPQREDVFLSDLDLYLLSEGRHERLWTVLGAHPRAGGCRFAVWAPNARDVRVVGDFTGWEPEEGVQLTRLGASGVWCGWVAGANPGDLYKFRIHGVDGVYRDKADPMATATECPPRTASVIERSGYRWRDAEWMATRSRQHDHHTRPMSIYEVHLASWRPGLSYLDLADALVEHVSSLNFTHVELMPVMEHPYGGSWGYHVTGYFAPTARLGGPDGLRHLIDRLHRAGIGVLLDWVPAHFPADDWALANFDGTPLYEHPDPRRGHHPDWGSLVFDYGRPQVRNFLIASALYWCEEFHIDGLRVDGVASMLYLDYSRGPGGWEPNVFGGNANLEAIEFIQQLNTAVYRHHPGVVMIAEESTAWPGVSRPVDWGGLGFGLKWNMGWMHDTLDFMAKDPIHREYHHDELTWPSVYAFDEQFLLPFSHDEVVHGKRALAAKLPGDRWQRLAGLRGLFGYMWAFPGKQLLFMGAELGTEGEWSEHLGLEWPSADDAGAAGLRSVLRDLNQVYRNEAALWSQDTIPAGFQWIAWDDYQGNVLSFLRWGSDGSVIACVVNFAGTPKNDYQIGLPFPGAWREVINTDAHCYGGSGVGNLGNVRAKSVPSHGLPASARVQVGPHAAIWLRPS